MSDCIFCQIIAGTIPSKPVYQDDEFMVISDIHPSAPVHLLVIPKKHLQNIIEADDTLIQRLFSLTKKIIQEKHIKDFRLVHNGEGAAAIPHLHVHVMGQVDKNRDL